MTKKKVLLLSSALFLAFTVLYTNYLPHTFCLPGSHCAKLFGLLTIVTLISVSLFPLSIIIFFSNEKIFLIWRKFTFIYFIIYLLGIAISPSEGDAFFRVEKGTVAIFLVIVYTLISLTLIAYKSYQLRKK